MISWFVNPAKAGIQWFSGGLDSRIRGNDDCNYENLLRIRHERSLPVPISVLITVTPFLVTPDDWLTGPRTVATSTGCG